MYDGSSLGWYLPISSITRPSRFLRESTTTMRYCGTRILPRRFKRILTATFVVSPQKLSWVRDRSQVGPPVLVLRRALRRSDERVRARRTRGKILPDRGRGPPIRLVRSARAASGLVVPASLPQPFREGVVPRAVDGVHHDVVADRVPADRGGAARARVRHGREHQAVPAPEPVAPVVPGGRVPVVVVRPDREGALLELEAERQHAVVADQAAHGARGHPERAPALRGDLPHPAPTLGEGRDGARGRALLRVPRGVASRAARGVAGRGDGGDRGGRGDGALVHGVLLRGGVP